MKPFRAIIAVLTLLAVAANPVAAALAMPCCCTKPVEQRRACCETKAAKPAAQPHSCCAKKSVTPVPVLQPGCCCVKAPPTSTEPRENVAAPKVEKRSLDVSLAWVDRGVPEPVEQVRDRIPSRVAISGPPLLALYCTWLK